ncbi:MAG: hypothetical protein ACT4P7_04830 [Gemmatimonadaceae bacterium]
MERYKNLSGDSGVTFFRIGRDFISVRFRHGITYHYDYTATGAHHVEQMKTLARAGKGLSTYVSQHVRNAYARKDP